MSLSAEATQNSNTIPKRHPTNCAACERSFCKLHLFTLQPATTQKSRLNSQAQAALLLCSIPSSPPAAAHGYFGIFGAGCAIPPALCPCLQDAGCGMWQLPPTGMQQQPPWSRASAAHTQDKKTHQRCQQAGIPSDPPLLPTAGCSKSTANSLQRFYGTSRMHRSKMLNLLLKLQITPVWLLSSRVSINQQSQAPSLAMRYNRLIFNVTCARLYSQTAWNMAITVQAIATGPNAGI